jgi:hypothetical protein
LSVAPSFRLDAIVGEHARETPAPDEPQAHDGVVGLPVSA